VEGRARRGAADATGRDDRAQEGLDWELWRRIARTTEDLGFESLWRSDHFFSLFGPHSRNALESFVSLVLVAETTQRLRFGPLVSAITFRHPALTARMAAQIDVLSGGRFVLGMGAGWNVPEHEAFGFPFPPMGERLDRLEEGVQVVRALWGDAPAYFEGRHYRLQGAECYPKPVQRPLPIIVGGGGERRTLRIVARYADEWNSVGGGGERRTLRIVARYADEWNSVGGGGDGYRHKRAVLERHCAEVGRDPATIRHSQMAAFVIGRDEAEQHAHLARIVEQIPPLGRQDAAQALQGLRERGWLVGTPGEIVEQIGRFEEAGMSRIMLQHHAQRDFATLELVAAEVLPQVQR
jgi:F420-dependent oxidoreductase-like protein